MAMCLPPVSSPPNQSLHPTYLTYRTHVDFLRTHTTPNQYSFDSRIMSQPTERPILEFGPRGISGAGPYDVQDDKNRSAIDCFVVVLRRLVEAIGKPKFTGGLPPGRSVLRLALSIGELDKNGSIRDKYLEQCIDSFDKSQEQRFVKGSTEYIRFSESDELLKILWSQKEFLLWHSVHRRPSGGREEDWLDRLSGEQQAIKYAQDSLVVFDPRNEPQDITLEKVLARRFGVRIFPNQEVEWKLVPAATICIRVHFIPDSDERWDFEKLCRVAAQGFETTILPMRWDYRLGAVVRMRAGPTENDLVRVYRPGHENILVTPRGHEGKDASYQDPNWRLGEASHQYMLYYIRCSTEALCPPRPGAEVGERREESAAYLEVMSLLDEQLEKWDKEAESAAPKSLPVQSGTLKSAPQGMTGPMPSSSPVYAAGPSSPGPKVSKDPVLPTGPRSMSQTKGADHSKKRKRDRKKQNPNNIPLGKPRSHDNQGT